MYLCIVRYLDYGEKNWKSVVRNHLDTMTLYSKEVKHNFHATLDWLQEHACSRSYGLGWYNWQKCTLYWLRDMMMMNNFVYDE